MSVAELRKKKPVYTIKSVRDKDFKGFGLKQLICFVFGFIFGFSGFSKDFSPFGVSFCAAAGKSFFPSSFSGAVLGYIVGFDSVTGLRYCATLLALAVITGSLKPFKTIRNHPATPVISVFVCLFVTGLAIVFSKEITALSLALCFCESLAGCGASYLFYRVRLVFEIKNGIKSVTSKEAISVIVSLSILLLSLRDVSFFGIHPADIIGMFIVLICGFYSRESGGAIVGICMGLSLSLGTENSLLVPLLSFGGLVCGCLSNSGKIFSAFAFVFSSAVINVLSYGKIGNINIIAECITASLIFVLLPKKAGAFFEEVLTPSVTSPIIESVKGDISKRLKNAAEISEEICGSINGVSEALIKSEKPDLSSICKKTKESVCGSCGLYDSCWGGGFEDTGESFDTLIRMKKEGVYLEYKTVPARFSSKCIRTENICSSFNRLYSEYKVREKTEQRINEINSLASEQFVNVSSLLLSLCDRMNEDIKFDNDIASHARNIASSFGLTPVESCCVINFSDRMSLELKVKAPKEKIDIGALTKQLELVADRKFSYPDTNRKDNETVFVFKEKEDFECVHSGVQICCNSEKYSGDTYSVFKDNDGCLYALICDGMGTGTRAAVNSGLAVSLAEKMLKAGFGTEAAVNTINTSLISKSFDECSVTFDLTSIDLFTGHVDFYKCGAIQTFVKKQGRVLEVFTPSMPLGILKNTEIGKGTGTLGKGDCIVMVSDGVREEDTGIIKAELKAFNSGNVREFTNNLATVIRENQPERNDDITVVTVALN